MNRIKELRKRRGLSQAELAVKFNVDQTAVSKWELEKAYPNIDLAIKIASYFDVSIEYLLGKEEYPYSILCVYQHEMIKNSRIQAGFSIDEVAEAVGISSKELQRYESVDTIIYNDTDGEKELDIFAKLSRIYSVKDSDLCGDTSCDFYSTKKKQIEINLSDSYLYDMLQDLDAIDKLKTEAYVQGLRSADKYRK